MVSSRMLRRVALVRTDVSEELTRATRRNIPEDTILHSHRRENLKSYILYIFFTQWHYQFGYVKLNDWTMMTNEF
jgi:hypothetical protein